MKDGFDMLKEPLKDGNSIGCTMSASSDRVLLQLDDCKDGQQVRVSLEKDEVVWLQNKLTTMLRCLPTENHPNDPSSATRDFKYRLLYGLEREQRDTYTFKIDSGGELGVIESGQVVITFKDGRFESASFPFGGRYTRNGWRVLSAIEHRISEIETLLIQQVTAKT
jgi:hypothetical protein